jgi:hypothetical protein
MQTNPPGESALGFPPSNPIRRSRRTTRPPFEGPSRSARESGSGLATGCPAAGVASPKSALSANLYTWLLPVAVNSLAPMRNGKATDPAPVARKPGLVLLDCLRAQAQAQHGQRIECHGSCRPIASCRRSPVKSCPEWTVECTDWSKKAPTTQEQRWENKQPHPQPLSRRERGAGRCADT